MAHELDAVELEIQWQRLISLLAEAALTVIRTAISKVVSEGGDFGCLLYDREGRMIAQDAGVSSKVSASPRTIEAVLKKYPAETLRPGDVLICNDPWLVCGHLYDVSVIKPLFHRGRLVALGECFGHVPDVGGSLSNNSREVYEEGLCLPIVRLMVEGRDNQDVWDILRSNVRVPNQIEGDIRAFTAALQGIEHRVSVFLDQYQIPDLQQLADQIISRSEKATRASIRKNIPPGVYTHQCAIDSVDADEPLTVQVAITVDGDSITVDFSGTSQQSKKAINCTEVYTYSWTIYAVRCLVSPQIPYNNGLFIPIRMKAPLGSLLSARHPAPVRMKSNTGKYVLSAIFGAMAKVIPERVVAESGHKCILRCFATGDDGRALAETLHFSGGMGARYTKDGIACMSFPGAGSETPVEMIENSLPVTILHKQLIADSGGPGRFRGGEGQEVAIRSEAQVPMTILLQNMKVHTPPGGYMGGGAGAKGTNLLNGKVLPGNATRTLQKGDVLEVQICGGGGMFDPSERSRAAITEDIAEELLSPEAAARDYGTAVDKVAASAEVTNRQPTKQAEPQTQCSNSG